MALERADGPFEMLFIDVVSFWHVYYLFVFIDVWDCGRISDSAIFDSIFRPVLDIAFNCTSDSWSMPGTSCLPVPPSPSDGIRLNAPISEAIGSSYLLLYFRRAVWSSTSISEGVNTVAPMSM